MFLNHRGVFVPSRNRSGTPAGPAAVVATAGDDPMHTTSRTQLTFPFCIHIYIYYV